MLPVSHQVCFTILLRPGQCMRWSGGAYLEPPYSGGYYPSAAQCHSCTTSSCPENINKAAARTFCAIFLFAIASWISCLSLRHALGSLWPGPLYLRLSSPLSLVIIPGQSHPCITNTTIELKTLSGSCLSMNIPFLSCLILSFQFCNLWVIRSVCLDLTWPAYL